MIFVSFSVGGPVSTYQNIRDGINQFTYETWNQKDCNIVSANIGAACSANPLEPIKDIQFTLKANPEDLALQEAPFTNAFMADQLRESSCELDMLKSMTLVSEKDYPNSKMLCGSQALSNVVANVLQKGPFPLSPTAREKQESILKNVWDQLDNIGEKRDQCAASEKYYQSILTVKSQEGSTFFDSEERSALVQRAASCYALKEAYDKVWSGDEPLMRKYINHMIDKKRAKSNQTFRDFLETNVPYDARGRFNDKPHAWNDTFEKQVLHPMRCRAEQRVKAFAAPEVSREVKQMLFDDGGVAAQTFIARSEYNVFEPALTCRMNARYGDGKKIVGNGIKVVIGGVAIVATGGALLGYGLPALGFVAAGADLYFAFDGASSAVRACGLTKSFQPGSLQLKPICERLKEAQAEPAKVSVLASEIKARSCFGSAVEAGVASLMAAASLFKAVQALEGTALYAKAAEALTRIENANVPMLSSSLSKLRQHGISDSTFITIFGKESPDRQEKILAAMGKNSLTDDEAKALAERIRMCK